MATRYSGGYGTQPPATAGQTPSPSTDETSLISRARRTTETVIARARPWREVLSLSSLSPPENYAATMDRLRWNLSYFRVNYAMTALLIVFLGLLWHPMSMIPFLLVFAGWFFLYFFRNGPVVVVDQELDDRTVMAGLGIITVLVLVFTDVGVNVLVSLVIGVCLVGFHAAFRETEDLFLDEESAGTGGLTSVVGGGQPVRSAYAPI